MSPKLFHEMVFIKKDNLASEIYYEPFPEISETFSYLKISVGNSKEPVKAMLMRGLPNLRSNQT
jgi:hypothetical protein